MKIKTNNQQLTVVALILYALIMISLILIYRDSLITITAIIIMVVLLIQYFVTLLRDRKGQKTRDVPHGEGEYVTMHYEELYRIQNQILLEYDKYCILDSIYSDGNGIHIKICTKSQISKMDNLSA